MTRVRDAACVQEVTTSAEVSQSFAATGDHIREPTSKEIALRMDIPVSKVRKVLKIAQEPISLETPIGEEEDSHLGDFIPGTNIVKARRKLQHPSRSRRLKPFLEGR